MHANEARQKTITDVAQKLYKKVEEAVTKAVNDGNLSTSVDIDSYNIQVVEFATKEIEAKGYTVSRSNGYYDQRGDGSVPARLCISWEKA